MMVNHEPLVFAHSPPVPPPGELDRQTQLDGCIVWNDTIQYSPEAVSYSCTGCFVPAFNDACRHVPATE